MRVNFPVFVENVSVDFCDHLRSGVPCVALGCLDVSVVYLQLVGGTRVTQRMKDNIRQIGLFFESGKSVAYYPVFTGTSVFLGKNKVLIHIVLSHEFFPRFLALPPLAENQCERFGYPDSSYTRVRFGLFKYEPGF